MECSKFECCFRADANCILKYTLMKNFINKLISCFLLPLLVISCNINSQSSLIKSENTIKTIKADVIRENYRQYLKNSLKLSDSVLTDELRKIKYDITFTKVTYEATDPFGKTKILSGLIGYPVLPAGDKDKQLSIVSIQHGTLFDESDACLLYTSPSPRD